MAEKIKTQEEPSIEEILGSIRRIIAEDEEDDVPEQASAAPRDPAPAFASAGPDPQPRPQPEDEQPIGDPLEDEEPLELTHKIEPDGTIENLSVSGPEEVPPVADEVTIEEENIPAEPGRDEQVFWAEEAEPMTEEIMDARQDLPAEEEFSPAQEGLLSETTAEAATAVMAKLARQSALTDDGQNVTIESLVREMLRPMLKEWLDQNLPDLVQKMVERELEKLTKRL